MQLQLERHEADVLLQVLKNYLPDLRFEISNTDKRDLREALKEDEVAIKALIARLEALTVRTSG